ncbi:Rop family plasmid primer RNA-binding protein [Enterobacter hormaechei]|uniref:Rop family plasmid primer RNA-binding protein n=1 Tax=Enterobacter hormaechei TaxID=158836 RepID=UPI00178706AF|nr:Rop family plasmid primer RNA-binding protein [Enterobacter hormaechei]MBE0234233.1 Rop family plasmid primer RNA-binding protein [Enterobacter hormaechei]
MTKQEKTALNMAKFIRDQSLLLLEKLNELDMDTAADMCERLQEDAETLWLAMRDQLGEE